MEPLPGYCVLSVDHVATNDTLRIKTYTDILSHACSSVNTSMEKLNKKKERFPSQIEIIVSPEMSVLYGPLALRSWYEYSFTILDRYRKIATHYFYIEQHKSIRHEFKFMTG